MEQFLMILSIAAFAAYLVLSAADSYKAEKGTKKRWTKGLLMPVLAVFFISAYCRQAIFAGKGPLENPAVAILTAAALLASFAGDTLLELDDRKFIFGLIGFWLAHVLYGSAFLVSVSSRAGFGAAFSRRPVWWAVPVCLVFVGYFIWLFPKMLKAADPRIKIPCLVYMFTIYASCLLAFYRAVSLFYSGSLTPLLTLIGYWLFVISDSILYFHMFADKPDRMVMETYTAAQLLIVLGLAL